MCWSSYCCFNARQDTLYVMGLMAEYERGWRWVVENLTSSLTEADIEVSVFETTIRYLGGLLSIFSLTGDIVFREKAVELADRY